MGAGYHGGFGKTYGDRVHKGNGLSNNEIYIRYKNLIDTKLVVEMEKNNIKFSKDSLVFVTKDKSGQIIFLETGKDEAGLNHIQRRHSREFVEAFGVKSKDIPNFLYKVISDGVIVDERMEMRRGREAFTKVYDYQGNYYILTGIGTNGFVVTARPAKKE